MSTKSTDPVTWSAALLVGLEALGLAVLAGWQVVALVTGDVGEPVSAIALIVLTVLGAVLTAAFAGAIVRGMSWGRSGAVVLQLLILAVAGGALIGEYAHPLVAVALAVPAVATLALLIAATRRSAPARPADDAED